MGKSKSIFMDERQKSLFQISNEFFNLEMELMNNGGEITPEIEKMLTINKSELKEKSKNYIAVIKMLEYETSYIDSEIKRLQQAKKSRKTTIERMKSSIGKAMNTYDIKEIDLITNKINFRKSEIVVIDCLPSELPKELQVIEIKAISKTEIKKMLKDGRSFDNIYIQENKNIQIK